MSAPCWARTVACAASSGRASISSNNEMCGTSRHASARLRAIARRTPRSGSRRSDRSRGSRRGTSAAVTRRPGPVPATVARSTPSSFASFRTGGAASTGPVPPGAVLGALRVAVPTPGCSGAAVLAVARPRTGVPPIADPASGTSSSRGAPTGTRSPTSAPSAHDGARRGHRQLHLGLVGLHVGDDLVARHVVTHRDPPLHQLGLGHALPEIGEEVRGIDSGIEATRRARRRRAPRRGGTSPRPAAGRADVVPRRRAGSAPPASRTPPPAASPPPRRRSPPVSGASCTTTTRPHAFGGAHDRVDVERRERAQVDHADASRRAASRAASAAATATSTIAPHVIIDRVVAAAHDLGASRAARGARRRGRRTSCGSRGSARRRARGRRSRIALVSRPLASAAFDGTTTLSPACARRAPRPSRCGARACGRRRRTARAR